MSHPYFYAKYDEKMDFLGKNLIGLLDAPKAKVKTMIPVLRDESEMEQRSGSAQELQDHLGDIADEVHEFLNATQGTSRLLRIRLKQGRVIDLSIKS
jgi:hypothetical protein